ncbi:ferritin heavy chain A-like [Sceloporus undulatus]|uniref:ferritin heavy chain A-like n=1 Tax=Sceloporus undulatus TaxID=8520 RepID=UPI001C4A7AFA|nr:ferritin heavy chain A-like [Sceloporus undulatus]
MDSQVNQNYHVDCEAAVNCMVTLELYASYTYLSMSYYFNRDDVALKHVAAFFNKESLKKRGDAEKWLKYQNQRGGYIILQDIRKPEKDEWENSLVAFQNALRLEEILNQALLDLHNMALQKGDPHMCDFLKSFLEEEVKAIKQLGDHISNLQRLEVPQNGLGEHLFDKHSLGDGR